MGIVYQFLPFTGTSARSYNGNAEEVRRGFKGGDKSIFPDEGSVKIVLIGPPAAAPVYDGAGDGISAVTRPGSTAALFFTWFSGC